MTDSLLIEIGTEELPAGVQEGLYSQGAGHVKKILSKNRLGFKEVFFEVTPRRIAIFAESLEPKQKEEKMQILGPAQTAAYDAEGKPTAALNGFLKSQQAKLEDVRVQETPRGKYVAVERVKRGESTAKLLPHLLPELLSSFAFPKMMRWEKTGFRFPRPVRWAVVLYGKKVISFSFAGIRTGRLTRGHRFLAPAAFSLPKADWEDYRKKLRAKHVILGREEREALIGKALKKNFHEENADPDLIRETAGLVEEPFLIQGKFSGTYRDLPEEVLTTCMKKYQKIFACHDPRGKLTNRFVAVMNGKRSGLSRIQADYENVLGSRLRDAQYFYHEDTEEPLEKKFPKLRELVFLGKLGTMQDKSERLQKLVVEFPQNIKEEGSKLARAALLSKIDLVTHMVGEFPELQGVMGREYAEAQGEPEDIARAIGEQYLPKNLGEEYSVLAKKMSPLGALFGIADRLDLLVGAFGIRLDPTGSEDPYALRRAGGALAKLVRAFGFHFSLSDLIGKSCALYQNQAKLDVPAAELTQKLKNFLKERAAFELQLKSGTRAYEIFQGIVKSSFDDLADVFQRFSALWHLASEEPKTFFKTGKIVERTSNILKGAKEAPASVDPALFIEPLERELFGLLEKKKAELAATLAKKDYEGLTRLYGDVFYQPLHQFFEKVMVNVEDAGVRRNRHALMRQINTLYTGEVADLSFITQLGE